MLNTPFLKIALVQHTFSCVLPMPRPEGDLVGAVFPWRCLWRTPMLYDQQLGLLLLLQRITEHFAASTLSVDHTHALDAVRMVVPACIACIADCVMRQIATDKPSRVCVHLRGTHERRGFTIGSAELAKQSGAVPVHTPELNTARTCALDYFAAQAGLPLLTMAVYTAVMLTVSILLYYLAAQAGLPQVYAWERSNALEVNTVRWVLYLLCYSTCYLPPTSEVHTVLRWVRQITQDLTLTLTLTLVLGGCGR